MEQPQKGEAQAVAEIVKANLEPEIHSLDLKEYGERFEGEKLDVISHVNRSGDLKLASLAPLLEERATRPARKKGTADLETVSSLVDHTKRFKSAHTAMFATRDDNEPTLITVFDYHESGVGLPAFGEHRARYSFPHSDAFKKWISFNEREIKQEALAELIDERIVDLIDPLPDRSALLPMTQDKLRNLTGEIASPTRMVQLAKGLEVTATHNVTNKLDVTSGQKTLIFKESHQDAGGQPLVIPEAFVIQIQVFRSGNPYQLPVRMRYRVKNGAITWVLSLYLLEEILEHAFTTEAKGAAAEAEVPLFFGTPEA
jgi:uncharacterized protein YfdQ (DUF2303 family)